MKNFVSFLHPRMSFLSVFLFFFFLYTNVVRFLKLYQTALFTSTCIKYKKKYTHSQLKKLLYQQKRFILFSFLYFHCNTVTHWSKEKKKTWKPYKRHTYQCTHMNSNSKSGLKYSFCCIFSSCTIHQRTD